MQVNSGWFEKLEVYGIAPSDLMNACTNIHVGAWILSQNIKMFGHSWQAIGAYNAGVGDNELGRRKYAQLIYQHYIDLLNANSLSRMRSTIKAKN